MDINSKLRYCRLSIESLARHDDMDAAVREAALDEVVRMVEVEREAARQRVQAKIDAALGGAQQQA